VTSRRWHSSTSNLIHDCFALVELLSTCAGDVVRVEIERIGAIENRVVEEQPTGGPP
jgi:hypothetical protein